MNTISRYKKRLTNIKMTPCKVKFNKSNLGSILRKLKCCVRVKRLNLIRYHHRIIRIKKCGVNVNFRPCRNFIKEEWRRKNALECSEILEKLVAESMQREKMMLEAKGKVRKTRTTMMFNHIHDDIRPSTPQEFFLNNFKLMPSKYKVQSKKKEEDEVSEESIVSFPSDETDISSRNGFSEPERKQSCESFPSSETDTISENSLAESRKEPYKIQLFPAKSFYKTSNIVERISETQETKECEEKEEENLVPLRPRRKLIDFKQTPERKKKFMKPMKVDVHRLSVCVETPSGSQDLISCPDCQRTFVKPGHLRKHLKRVHKKTTEEDESDEESVVFSDTPDSIFCEPCKIPFSTLASLRKHESIHHNVDIEQESPMKEQRQCSECSKQFLCSASLKRHILTDHRGFKSKCPRCGEMVARLDNHIATVHESSLSPCPHCSILLGPAHLSRHIKTVHFRYRHRCVLCDRFISNVHAHNKSMHKNSHKDPNCLKFSGPHSSKLN